MRPENKQFLEDNRQHWITLRDAKFCRHLDGNTRSGMMRVMAEEFRPGYTSDLWCGTCVAEMVKQLYMEFEKWEAAQASIMPELEPPVVIPPVDPPKPAQVQASFPSHKHRRR